jgi:nicotinamidase-related amidase
VWDEEEATFMRPGTEGVDIHPAVAPLEGELVITKEHPNSFRETPLEQELRTRDVDELVVCGMMTSMCVHSAFLAALADGYAEVAASDEIAG